MSSRKWFRVALINLLVLSIVGVVLRYKIVFELEWVDQKHLLHGHSHFAFAGWVSQALMTLLVATRSECQKVDLFPKYRWLLLLNLLTAYGMLFSFIAQGYGLVSISFSTASILVSYVFGLSIWREINASGSAKNSDLFFKSAIVFNILSSFGAFALAYLMANKIIHQNWYLSAIYFFLHFQYNGWFTMACFGFTFHQLENIQINTTSMRSIALMFIIACVPAFFLSILWIAIPEWLHLVITIAAIVQIIAWLMLVKLIKKKYALIRPLLTTTSKWVFGLASAAMTIKVFLQAGSTIHALSNWAFGFRPIVIGYLHLVLLGVITLFILGYAMHIGAMKQAKALRIGIVLFISGIILNECILMLQGTAAISDTVVPYANEMLLSVASIMFSGLAIMQSDWMHRPPDLNGRRD